MNHKRDPFESGRMIQQLQKHLNAPHKDTPIESVKTTLPLFANLPLLRYILAFPFPLTWQNLQSRLCFTTGGFFFQSLFFRKPSTIAPAFRELFQNTGALSRPRQCRSCPPAHPRALPWCISLPADPPPGRERPPHPPWPARLSRSAAPC